MPNFQLNTPELLWMRSSFAENEKVYHWHEQNEFTAKWNFGQISQKWTCSKKFFIFPWCTLYMANLSHEYFWINPFNDIPPKNCKRWRELVIFSCIIQDKWTCLNITLDINDERWLGSLLKYFFQVSLSNNWNLLLSCKNI